MTARTQTAASAMLRTARRLLALLVLLAALWVAGLVWFAEQIPSAEQTVIPDDVTDAVVVLTGGPLRLKAGLVVLETGKARKLFVSGVARGIDLADLFRAAQLPAPPPECCVVLGHAADNTEGNAIETRAWMAAEGLHSLRLVTASFHMKRSLLEFRRAMPDMVIVPHPVFQDGFMRDMWWAWPGTFALIAGEYNKYLAAVVRTLLFEQSAAMSPS
jgi:uncharacterized SAM-binding protein YcdF (DUF218 family)